MGAGSWQDEWKAGTTRSRQDEREKDEESEEVVGGGGRAVEQEPGSSVSELSISLESLN